MLLHTRHFDLGHGLATDAGTAAVLLLNLVFIARFVSFVRQLFRSDQLWPLKKV